MKTKPEFVKTAERLIQETKKETDYYQKLWNNLTINELESMRASNVFSKSLLQQYNFYLPFRKIREALPVVGTIIAASIIWGEISKMMEK